MKVNFKEEKKVFVPFSFTVTVETEAEARLWYHISNHVRLAERILSDPAYNKDGLYSEDVAPNLPGDIWIEFNHRIG